MDVHVLLPRPHIIRKVGGPDFRYYVEMDGDDADLDGSNMVEGANEKPWFDAGLWRLEIQPAAASLQDRFLVILKPRLAAEDQKEIHPVSLLTVSNGVGVYLGDTCVLFAGDLGEQRRLSYTVPSSENPKLHIWANFPPGVPVKVACAGEKFHGLSNAEGVLSFETKGSGPCEITSIIN